MEVVTTKDQQISAAYLAETLTDEQWGDLVTLLSFDDDFVMPQVEKEKREMLLRMTTYVTREDFNSAIEDEKKKRIATLMDTSRVIRLHRMM